MVNFKKTKSVQPRQGNKAKKTPRTMAVTKRDKKKVGMEIFEKNSNILKI